MQNDIPFVTIPEHLKEILGEPNPGTRTFRRYGQEEDLGRDWLMLGSV